MLLYAPIDRHRLLRGNAWVKKIETAVDEAIRAQTYDSLFSTLNSAALLALHIGESGLCLRFLLSQILLSKKSSVEGSEADAVVNLLRLFCRTSRTEPCELLCKDLLRSLLANGRPADRAAIFFSELICRFQAEARSAFLENVLIEASRKDDILSRICNADAIESAACVLGKNNLILCELAFQLDVLRNSSLKAIGDGNFLWSTLILPLHRMNLAASRTVFERSLSSVMQTIALLDDAGALDDRYWRALFEIILHLKRLERFDLVDWSLKKTSFAVQNDSYLLLRCFMIKKKWSRALTPADYYKGFSETISVRLNTKLQNVLSLLSEGSFRQLLEKAMLAGF